VYDDQVIESISLLNDDSSDGFESKSYTKSNLAVTQVDENLSSSEKQNSALENTIVDTVIENIEVKSDSSPEIVSVEMPTRISGIAKKTHNPVVTTTTVIAAKRTPIRFSVTPKLKNVNSSQVSKRNANPMIGTGAVKVSRGTLQQSDRSFAQSQMQAHSSQQSKARTMIKKTKPSDGKDTRVAAAEASEPANT
jgi:septum formation inhibitor MinC